MVGSSRVFGDRVPKGQKKLVWGGGWWATPKSAPPFLLLTACFLSPAHNLVAPKSRQSITW